MRFKPTPPPHETLHPRQRPTREESSQESSHHGTHPAFPSNPQPRERRVFSSGASRQAHHQTSTAANTFRHFRREEPRDAPPRLRARASTPPRLPIMPVGSVKHKHLLRERGGRSVCQRWGGRETVFLAATPVFPSGASRQAPHQTSAEATTHSSTAARGLTHFVVTAGRNRVMRHALHHHPDYDLLIMCDLDAVSPYPGDMGGSRI